VSERTSLRGDTARAYYVVNLTLFGRDLVKGLDGSVSAYNLFDYRYGDPTGNKTPEDILPQDGRSFRAKLTYRF
jgi:iron complex outermembrane receptor protein